MRIRTKIIQTYGKKNYKVYDTFGHGCLYPKDTIRLIKVFNLLTLKSEEILQISDIDNVCSSDGSVYFNTWKKCNMNTVKVPIELSRYLKIKKLNNERHTNRKSII